MVIEALAFQGRLEITHAMRDLCERWCWAAVAIWTEDVNNRVAQAVMLISFISSPLKAFASQPRQAGPAHHKGLRAQTLWRGCCGLIKPVREASLDEPCSCE